MRLGNTRPNPDGARRRAELEGEQPPRPSQAARAQAPAATAKARATSARCPWAQISNLSGLRLFGDDSEFRPMGSKIGKPAKSPANGKQDDPTARQ